MGWRAFTPDQWDAHITKPGRRGFTLVAERDGQVVGHVLIEYEEGALRIIDFVVESQHQKRYVGTQLLQEILEIAKNSHATRGRVQRRSDRFVGLSVGALGCR